MGIMNNVNEKYIPRENSMYLAKKFKKIATIGKGSFGEVILVKEQSDGQINQPEEGKINQPDELIKKEDDDMTKSPLYAIKKSYTKSTSNGTTFKLTDNDWEREYTILSMLCHESIIRVNYLFKIYENNENVFCLIMEYFPGVDLNAFIDHQKRKNMEDQKMYRMLIKDQLAIIIKLLNVIKYLHKLGIIHRDIKPGNIMYNPKCGTIKLIDFTFASYYLDEPETPEQLEYATCTKVNKGTPLFMPREMIFSSYENFKVETRSNLVKSDIWAMGITIYCMIAGYEPFNASNYKEFKGLMINPPVPLYGVFHTTYFIESLIKDCLLVDYHDRPDINELCSAYLPRLEQTTIVLDGNGNEIFEYENRLNNMLLQEEPIFEFEK